jgi:hypothetical protein
LIFVLNSFHVFNIAISLSEIHLAYNVLDTVIGIFLNLNPYHSKLDDSYHQSNIYHSFIGSSGSITYSQLITFIAAVDQLQPLKSNVIVSKSS